jgi:peptidoglycan-associated lipoprotein
MRKETALLRYASVLALILMAGACRHRPGVAQLPPIEAPTPAPAPPAAPACTLTAEPAAVEQGKSVTLSWTSQNATDLDLQPGLGKQQAQGSTSVTPQDSTTYTLAVSGPGGNSTCVARVTLSAPSPPPPATVKEENLEDEFNAAIKDAYFDFNKADLRPEAQQALATDAAFLKSHPDLKVTIEGHCDARGSEEYNLGLGDLRATAARNFLVNLGVSADRLTTITYGKDRPVCTEMEESCWSKNRRAHPVRSKAG